MSVDVAKYLEENKGLIYDIAKDFNIHSSKFSHDDLIQEGNLIAIRAIEKWTPGKAKLSTYIYSAVRRGLRDLVRENTYDLKYTKHQQTKDYKESLENSKEKSEAKNRFATRLSPVALRLDMPVTTNGVESESFGNTIPSGSPPPLDNMIKQEQIDILNEEIDSLNEREQEIVRSRFFDGKTLDELAREQGCTRQRISQISKRAMEKLTGKVKTRLGGELFV